MAGLGRRTFAAGEVLTASNVMGYLQDQAVMNFAGTAARGSAIGSAVSEGMVSYLADSNSIEVYTGSYWNTVSQATSPNAVINGDFGINQRAFTSTTTNGAYGFDRWKLFYSGGSTTYSAQAFTPGAAPVAGYEAQNYARLVTTGYTSSGWSILQQPIEDVRTFAGQTVTLSFWAKAGSGTPKIMPSVEQNFGSGGSPSSAVRTKGSAVTLSTSWARYSVTISVPSISGKTIGSTANTSSIFAELWVSGEDAGYQNATFDIWGVQLEAGSTATPFRRNANSLQGELAACQRYFQSQVLTADGDSLMMGASYNNIYFLGFYYLPVIMRSSASVSFSGTFSIDLSGTTSVTASTISGSATSSISRVFVTHNNNANFSSYKSSVLTGTNGSRINYSAEL